MLRLDLESFEPQWEDSLIIPMMPIQLRLNLEINGEDDPLLKIATKKWNLVTLRDIKEGEELTVRYTFYNV